MSSPRIINSISTSPEIAVLTPSFARSLRAEGKSPKTIRAYTDAVALLDRFLSDLGMPTGIAAITREHLQMFSIDQRTRWRPATALNRHASLRAFFRWAVEEGEIVESPMRN